MCSITQNPYKNMHPRCKPQEKLVTPVTFIEFVLKS